MVYYDTTVVTLTSQAEKFSLQSRILNGCYQNTGVPNEQLARNKPAAQAAGANPSRCNSTNSQIRPSSKIGLPFELLMGF